MSHPLTVYSASAGSGKTFTLTAYYIAKLLQDPAPDGFRHLLAVTFTVKATGEMKDRILGTLYNLSLIARRRLQPEQVDGETRSYLATIARLTRGEGAAFAWPDEVYRVSREADKRLKAILKDYDRFRVVTIDSFFQSVLRGVARELGLPATLRTEIANEEVRHMAVERLMDELPARPDLRRQVSRFVNDRLDNDQKWSVGKLLYDFSRWLFEEEYAPFRLPLASLPEGTLDRMQALLRELGDTAAAAVEEAAQPVLKYLTDYQILEEPAYCTKSGASRFAALRKRCQAMLDFSADRTPGSTLAGMLANPIKFYAGRKHDAALQPQCEGVAALALAAEEVYATALPAFLSARLALDHLHQLGLLEAVGHEANLINEEQDQFILSNTGQLLADLMGTTGNNTFIFEKIGPALNHVMIDEFQDTSSLQWSNFHPLIEELISSSDGNGLCNDCLIVGDIKQSIYRWRGGDWQTLYGIDRQFLPSMVGRVPLNENFRSERTIVDFNNLLFPPLAARLDALNPSAEGRGVIASVYAEGEVLQRLPAHKAGRADNGFARVHIYDNKAAKRDPETGAYAEMRRWMVRLHREQGVPWGDMAILVRTSTHTDEIIRSIGEDPDMQGVRVVSGSAFMLQSSWAVRLVVAALRTISDPQDGVAQAFVELMREQGVALSEEGFEGLDDLTLQELNLTLIGRLGLGQYGDQAPFLTAYMDQVSAYVQNNPADVPSFLQCWDDRLYKEPVSNTAADAISIVTIHKSKGLAFPHVFIPDCDFHLSEFKSDHLKWLDTAGREAPYDTLPVLPVSFFGRQVGDTLFAPDRNAEVGQLMMDNLNLLYVAFTRARSSLFLWGQRSRELKESSTIATLIDETLRALDLPEENRPEEGIYQWGSELRRFERETSTAKSPLEPLFLHAIPCRLAALQESGQFQPNYRQSTDSLRLLHAGNPQLGIAIAEGSQMHGVLAYVKQASDLDAAIARYRSETVLTPRAERQLRQLFQMGLAREEGDVSDWFSGRYQVFNEQTLLLPHPDESLGTSMPRPDRVMVSQERIVVVDYKFTSYHTLLRERPDQLDRYRAQVQAYMHALRRLYPDPRPIEGYLWFLKDTEVIILTTNH